MKHVVLHIGTGKTGTSTIQNALFRNRRLLRKRYGVDYARLGLMEIEHFGEQIAAHYQLVERLRHGDTQDLRELTDYIDSRAENTIIFSCENLYHHLGHADIARLAELLAPYRVTIICYVRRQDLYVESAYRQQVKVGVAKVGVRPFLARHMSANSLDEVHANYHRMLMRWDEHFGTQAIRVRLFDKACFSGGDLVTDFLQAAGVQEAKLKRPHQTHANQAVPAQLISVLRAFNAAGIIPREQHQEFVQDMRASYDFKDYPLISDDVRSRILDNYAASNQQLFAHFGIRGNWSVPDSVSTADSVPGVGAESDTDILSALLYQAWLKQRRTLSLHTLLRRAYYFLNDWLFYARSMRRPFDSESLLPREDYLRLLRRMIAHREFSPTFYLRFNADIASGGLDPLLHYLQYGLREVRIPHPAVSEIEARSFARSVSSGEHPYLSQWASLGGGSASQAGAPGASHHS